MFGLLFFGYFISYSLAAIELDASTIEPLVNYTASRSFSREKSVQSCQWRRPVGASSWWCRKDTRLPSGTKVCWNEGKTSAEIKFGVICFDYMKSQWQEKSTSNVWHVATFHWQYMKAAVRLGYEFLDTSVVDAVQVRLWSIFVQNLVCTLYNVRCEDYVRMLSSGPVSFFDGAWSFIRLLWWWWRIQQPSTQAEGQNWL